MNQHLLDVRKTQMQSLEIFRKEQAIVKFVLPFTSYSSIIQVFCNRHWFDLESLIQKLISLLLNRSPDFVFKKCNYILVFTQSLLAASINSSAHNAKGKLLVTTETIDTSFFDLFFLRFIAFLYSTCSLSVFFISL